MAVPSLVVALPRQWGIISHRSPPSSPSVINGVLPLTSDGILPADDVVDSLIYLMIVSIYLEPWKRGVNPCRVMSSLVMMTCDPAKLLNVDVVLPKLWEFRTKQDQVAYLRRNMKYVWCGKAMGNGTLLPCVSFFLVGTSRNLTPPTKHNHLPCCMPFIKIHLLHTIFIFFKTNISSKRAIFHSITYFTKSHYIHQHAQLPPNI